MRDEVAHDCPICPEDWYGIRADVFAKEDETVQRGAPILFLVCHR